MCLRFSDYIFHLFFSLFIFFSFWGGSPWNTVKFIHALCYLFISFLPCSFVSCLSPLTQSFTHHLFMFIYEFCYVCVSNLVLLFSIIGQSSDFFNESFVHSLISFHCYYSLFGLSIVYSLANYPFISHSLFVFLSQPFTRSAAPTRLGLADLHSPALRPGEPAGDKASDPLIVSLSLSPLSPFLLRGHCLLMVLLSPLLPPSPPPLPRLFISRGSRNGVWAIGSGLESEGGADFDFGGLFLWLGWLEMTER